jgi:hypothetical protein
MIAKNKYPPAVCVEAWYANPLKEPGMIPGIVKKGDKVIYASR